MLNARRYRRALIAFLATLGISAILLGMTLFVRWRSERAVRGDTHIVLTQASQQLLRALQSRRGTLTMLRGTLDKTQRLGETEQQALATSAVAHTRHLLGVGFIRATEPLKWWTLPASTSSAERALLARAVAQRARLHNSWRVPSTLTVVAQEERPFLVMLEPLRARVQIPSAIVGVFDLTPLLADFFDLILQQPYPVQLLEADQVWYRSSRWQLPLDGRRPTTLQLPMTLDAVHWTLQMQPGSTQVFKAISSFHLLLITMSLLAAGALIGLIWLLAMRTWILQRAVARRTASLRRTTERLRQLAITDELTGLVNRRFFLERWQWECERAKRYGRPLMCLMVDVNGFKQVNDFLGHQAGDLVLQQVAQELKRILRHSDILARFGGDEFILALPETSVEQATAVAEKLRGMSIQGPWMSHRHLGPVRLSVGLRHVQPTDSAEQAIQHADAALYASRRNSAKQNFLKRES
jgi:diguanylate cyclase (GGDEF)-like protein